MITTIKYLVFIAQTDGEKQILIEIRYHKKTSANMRITIFIEK
jgi:hypothetical protein